MRLIDADKLLLPDIESEKVLIIGNRSGKTMQIAFDLLKRKIKTAPTIDAVPVVRCRECKHFNLQTHECENESVSTDHEGGASYSLNFYDDDFCSYGEKRK